MGDDTCQCCNDNYDCVPQYVTLGGQMLDLCFNSHQSRFYSAQTAIRTIPVSTGETASNLFTAAALKVSYVIH